MMSVGKDAASGSYYGGQDNYYFMGSLENVWMGEGAKELGLTGEVDSKVFDRILEGKLPNGQQLGKTVDGKSTHRSGYDLTFSAPKSVSLVVLMGDDERLLSAHMKAVEHVAEQIEQLISARVTKDKVTETVYTEKMVAAAYTHDTSRNHDPQLHTHLVVANVTEHEGKWRALATDKINNTGFIETVMKHQVTLGQMYRNYLRKEVEKAGHEVEIVGNNGLWEITGVPKEVREEFSTRSQDIKESVGDLASLHSKDMAALDTRNQKVEKNPDELKAEWILRAKEKGFDVHGYLNAIKEKQTDSKPEAEVVDKHQKGDLASPDKEQLPARTPPVIEGQDRPNNQPQERENPQSLQSPQSKEDTKSPQQAPIDAREPPSKTDKSDLQTNVDHVNEPTARKPQESRLDAYQTQDVAHEKVDFFMGEAIKVLSNEKAQFSYGDLLSKAVGLAEGEIGIKAFKGGINNAIESGAVIPLNEDKGVFTSRIHVLDELSIQSMAKEVMATERGMEIKKLDEAVVNVDGMRDQALLIVNAKGAGAKIQREQVSIISDQAKAMGRIPLVLAGSVSSMNSLRQNESLSVINKNMLLKDDFFMRDNSTVIIDHAEKLSLKEATVLLGYAQQSNSQIVFVDTEGVSGVGNALSVLKNAGVQSERVQLESSKIPTSINSIPDRLERLSEVAKTYADARESGDKAIVIGTNQKDMRATSALIRDELQDRGLISREQVAIEARTPVYLTDRTRKDISNYQKGMVVEVTQEDRSIKSFVISGVHEKTRKLSVIDSGGSKDLLALKDFDSGYKLYQSEIIQVAAGDSLRAVANNYDADIKAKDQLKVTEIDQGWIEVERKGRAITLSTNQPLYVQHDYVSGVGAKVNDSGTVIALLKGADLTPQTLNSLATSGDELKIFTAEKQDKAEKKIETLSERSSPLKLISKITETIDPQAGIESLKANVNTDVEKSVNFAIEQLMNKQIVFSNLDVQKHAMAFSEDVAAIKREVDLKVKTGELIGVQIKGERAYVGREAYEMEKTIIRTIHDGKGTQLPLLGDVDPKQLESRLTKGQAEGAKLILTSTDQFIGIQGYAGVGKTFMLTTVQKAINTLPEAERPTIQGLAPTHQAVSEMLSVGIDSKTVKSFLMENQDMHSLSPNQYKNQIFLVDESSMIGNPDMAATVQIIQKGGGRAVMMGDKSQHISPEGSAPFELTQERSSLDVAIIKDIQRQINWSLKGAVYDLIDHKPEAALQKIASVSSLNIGRKENAFTPETSVIDFSNPLVTENLAKKGIESIHDAIAKDYAGRTDTERAATLIVTHTNKDRLAVNSAIHDELKNQGVLKGQEVSIPILRRLADDKKSLNNIDTYKAGNVLQIGDKFLDVVSVNNNDGLLVLKDESGKVSLISPFENTNPDMALYEKSKISVAEGEKIRLSKTIKESGHQANQDFTITKIDESGRLHVTGKTGDRVFNPLSEKADRVIDYSYAKTSYHHQGASEKYVITLEGVEQGRKNLATLRSFYVSASREKEHIQIYSDNLDKWLTSVSSGDKKILTVHDAISPEPDRIKGKKIWDMGTPMNKTKIGSMLLKQNELPSFAARVIPATDRFPKPHLAIPVYGENGKFGGIQLKELSLNKDHVSVAGDRAVSNSNALWSVLKISKTGLTRSVDDFQRALSVMRENPEDGLILKLSNQEPPEQLYRLSKGTLEGKPDGELTNEQRAQRAQELSDELKAKEVKELEVKQLEIQLAAEKAKEASTKGGQDERIEQGFLVNLTDSTQFRVQMDVQAAQSVVQTLSDQIKPSNISIDLSAIPGLNKESEHIPNIKDAMISMTEKENPILSKAVSEVVSAQSMSDINIKIPTIEHSAVSGMQLESVQSVSNQLKQQEFEQTDRIQSVLGKEQSEKTKEIIKERSLDKSL